ncbi:unnamed protein product [Cuscuta campestris]|uniref:F-box domain-containing protein n=1 Tax=Cuscuta campestris TaxID=132261 RepID=A0A484MYW3_9ASTE|nr:unnamed protein product [Cuscuta campestris]
MSERHHFPEELLIEILKRLPVRSLVRFTAVSKSWFLFITSPAFASAHLRHSRCKDNSGRNLLLHRRVRHPTRKGKYEILCESDHQTLTPISSPELPLSIPDGNEILIMLGCCNGVVCLVSNPYSESRSIYLWNPCIQKLMTLPSAAIIRPWCSSVLGFGVDPEGGLKVVRVVLETEKGSIRRVSDHVEIYSLGTGTWRRISVVGVNPCKIILVQSQTFVHGAVHWIGSKLMDDNARQNCIIVFSMSDEVFSEIMLPDELANAGSSSSKYLRMVAFGESVVVSWQTVGMDGLSFELWMMKEYGVVGSWCRLHRMEPVEWVREVVCLRKNGDVFISTNDEEDGELVSYCPNTGAVSELGIYGSDNIFYVFEYLESLVLLQEQSCVIDGISEEMTSLALI